MQAYTSHTITGAMTIEEINWVRELPIHWVNKKVPAQLQLCHGLLVLIYHNDAMILGITQGQEGHVVGWKSHLNSRNE